MEGNRYIIMALTDGEYAYDYRRANVSEAERYSRRQTDMKMGGKTLYWTKYYKHLTKTRELYRGK